MCVYLVVDAVQVGMETLLVPPACVRDLSADVSCVRCAEGLLVVIPAERVFHCTAKARDVEPVLSRFVLDPAPHTHTHIYIYGNWETLLSRATCIRALRSPSVNTFGCWFKSTIYQELCLQLIKTG